MNAKKNAARYNIQFNPDISSHQEAMQTLDEAGRGKAALIADAIRIRNALYSRNVDAISLPLQNDRHGKDPAQSPQKRVIESAQEKSAALLPLPLRGQPHDAVDPAQSEADFWNDIDNTLDMFSQSTLVTP